MTHMFEFTNSGDEPLIIDSRKGSCGCTVPKCPKSPFILARRDKLKWFAQGKKNQQTKKVTINANTDPLRRS